ncbi:MAG TPA: hypothetical protein VHE83_11205 [Mycobacteriales bacterium]|nr:hypothetical protein [Mycobacteriales bacterium]
MRLLARGVAALALVTAAACSSTAPAPVVHPRPPVSIAASTAAGLSTSDRTAAVDALLARRAAAVLRHDRAAFLSTVDPQAPPPFAHRQQALVAALMTVPFASYALAVDPTVTPAVDPMKLATHSADDAWLPQTTLTYTLRGGDGTSSTLLADYTFVRRGQDWFIASDDDVRAGAPGTQRDLWDYGPVVAVRGSASLVLAHPGSEQKARAVAALADHAVRSVTAVWGRDWPRRVVVVIPGSMAELQDVVQDHDDLSQFAALESAELGRTPGRTELAQRIAVNPSVFFGQTTDQGRQVIMTHETTHAASSRSTRAGMPTWLIEGLADYVGFRDVDVPLSRAAAALQARIRTSGAPQALPADKEFAGSSAHLEEAYEEAWLACRLIAQVEGQAALVRLYRAVGAGASVPDAFASVLHTTVPAFTASWRAALLAELA